MASLVRLCAAFSVRRTSSIVGIKQTPSFSNVIHRSSPSPAAKDKTTFLTRCFAIGPNAAEESDEMHRKYYSMSGIGQRSRVTCTTNTNHTLETDVPKKMGGSDAAPQPVEHLLSALLGCTQATAVYVGRMMRPRLLIEKIDFEIEAYRDERGAISLPITETPSIPARLQSVTGSVVVHFKDGMKVSEEQLRILGQQTEQRCPVANMIMSSGCVMDMEWKNGAIEDDRIS